MSQQRIKLVHTSDVHLDGRFSPARDSDPHRNPHRNVAERAFARVVDTALAEQADLLLIVGDLFDNNRVNDDDFQFVYSQLSRLNCPVALTAGNHDVHDNTSVWARLDWSALGKHVHALTDHAGESVYLEALGARLWGRGMAEHSPDYQPLADLPDRRDRAWNIGLAHGEVVTRRSNGIASQITHDEIVDSGFDYLALGHVHVWREMQHGETTACYPGSPVANYASAAGGHVAVVTLDPDTGIAVRRQLVDERERDHGAAPHTA